MATPVLEQPQNEEGSSRTNKVLLPEDEASRMPLAGKSHGEAILPTLLHSRARTPKASEEGEQKDFNDEETAGTGSAPEMKDREEDQEEGQAGDEDDEDHEAENDASEEAQRELDEAARKRMEDDEFFWSAAQAALRERERLEKVNAFLKAHGFAGVNARRGWIFSYDYPLHCAAKHGDLEMVKLLLASKAVRRQRNSEGCTARQVAKNQNFRGSHGDVIKALTGKKRPKKAAAAAAAPDAATTAAAADATTDVSAAVTVVADAAAAAAAASASPTDKGAVEATQQEAGSGSEKEYSADGPTVLLPIEARRQRKEEVMRAASPDGI
mmetsp:Transcript_76828/g.167941  ORF Transcript_76828/g.167941 Transcript_76828/m.167941 type:complete len:326 (-) Transcript_76828:58-1035(-)